MTAEHFEQWFAHKLLLNVQPHSLIVMDNASYHSRRSEPLPVKSWTKKRMQEWLLDKGIQFPQKAVKAKIFDIIKRQNPTARYVVDDLAAAAGDWLFNSYYALVIMVLNIIFPGHEVVRLPVSHCTLNPIELAWAQVKGHVKANANAFNLTEVEQLAWEGFGIVTADRWCKLIRHVRDKVEDHYWTSDGLYEQTIRHFAINFGSDLETDTARSDDSDSDHDGGTSDEDPDCDSDDCVCSCED